MFDVLVVRDALVRVIHAWIGSLDMASNAQSELVVYAAPAERCGACTLKTKCIGSKQRLVRRIVGAEAVDDQWTPSRRTSRDDAAATAHCRAFIRHNQARDLAELQSADARFKGAKGELSLAILAYHLKQLTNSNGASWVLTAVRA